MRNGETEKEKEEKEARIPFRSHSSILERNATECFATRNVAGAGTGSSFSRVLDPWKTAIKRFISTPLLRASTFLPSFLPPIFHLSFLVVEIHACDVFLPSSFPTFIHLSLSLFLYKIPFTPVRCLHRPGLRHVYFPRRDTSRYRGLPLPPLGGRTTCLFVKMTSQSERERCFERVCK